MGDSDVMDVSLKKKLIYKEESTLTIPQTNTPVHKDEKKKDLTLGALLTLAFS